MRRRFGLAALALATAAGPALAQFGRRRGGMGERDSRPADKGGGEPGVNALEVTLHELHEDLKLTAAQEPAWDSYIEKVRALSNDVARERAQRPAQLSVVQRIDRVVDGVRNRLTAVEDIAQAAKALYASLTTEQQPAADPRLANIMAMPLQQQPEGFRGRAPR